MNIVSIQYQIRKFSWLTVGKLVSNVVIFCFDIFLPTLLPRDHFIKFALHATCRQMPVCYSFSSKKDAEPFVVHKAELKLRRIYLLLDYKSVDLDQIRLDVSKLVCTRKC